MSITPRARSSVLAPSLTRIASGRSLMTVRNAPSAPWKSMGDLVFVSRGAILAMFSSRLRLDGVDPVRRRRRPIAAHAVEERRYAGADVADHRRDDLDVRVHLLRLDVDLDEFLRRVAPGLALAVRQEPVEPSADQHHDVGVLQHRRARRARALRMRVGQKALGHAHRQERYAAFFDQGADLLVGLRVCRPFAENNQGALGALQDIERTRDRRPAQESAPAPRR